MIYIRYKTLFLNMETKIDKKLITDIVFIAACFGIYIFFPALNFTQQILATIVFFLLMPWGYKKFVLKEKLIFSGFKLGNYKEGVKWSIITLLSGLLIYWLVYENSDFIVNYKLPIGVKNSFYYFVLYELLIVPLFVFMYEAFFRGFLLFSFSKKIGYWSVVLQAFIFMLLVWSQGFGLEFTPYLIFALFAGLIAYKSESILYSFVTQWIFVFLVDVSVIKMLQ